MKKVFRQHGTRSMYQGGCRCEACIRADRQYHREYYQRWVTTPNGQAMLKRQRLRQAGIRQLARAARAPRPILRLPSAPRPSTADHGAGTPEAELQ